MAKIMAVNAGSSSLKFQLLEMPAEEVIAQGLIERIGMEDAIFTIKFAANDKAEASDQVTVKGQKAKFQTTTAIKDHGVAINMMLEQLSALDIIEDFNEIVGVGHRVVAGGEYFDRSVLITDDVLAKIDELADYAPLHNPANAMGIRVFQKLLPEATEVAVFDTSFHQSMPKVNYLYSLPYKYYEKYGARKYGAHGTSHRYVAGKAAELLGKPLESLKLITLHLGAGASITAVKNGQSFDTSMGFTPLAGVTMATRSGDVDASLVSFIQGKENLSNDEMLTVLNKQSGLQGISELSSDMRDLRAARKENDKAELAINIFVDRVVSYIGQYIAKMDGADAIVFTAGIGENADWVREEVVDRLGYFGIKIDAEKNEGCRVEADISAADAKIKTLVVPTDEELMIARDVQSLMK
ncbi:acetate/propionate family kinase [Fructobacillus parabroussonetiae]|uniref:Acetate kinase n=1 Tax=Fructobacillus parabroussonetiae TaxID=2713174 RepID=A0ABS5QYB9_9LACO|nr:acetate kinase [Fructobacillus parabroussonetiae]MBS9337972.1 acetate kinase [Fructobacillus parabroussonetiae]MCK8617825.1 acetate kinase [Fructobacillus parabroussonetiae]